MKRIIRLTESDLTRIVKRIIKEQEEISKTQEIPAVTVTGDSSKTQEIPAVTVTGDSSKYFYNIKLRKPTSDGYTTLKYILRTGELRGDGNEENVIATIQKNQTKEQVTAWLERNRIKLDK